MEEVEFGDLKFQVEVGEDDLGEMVGRLCKAVLTSARGPTRDPCLCGACRYCGSSAIESGSALKMELVVMTARSGRGLGRPLGRERWEAGLWADEWVWAGGGWAGAGRSTTYPDSDKYESISK